MHDMRALRNPTSLSSWRAWEREAYQRSGFVAIAAGLFAPLTFAFAIFPSLLASTPARASVPIFLVALILYLAAALGLMAVGVLRVNAWKRANPWTPPSLGFDGGARSRPKTGVAAHTGFSPFSAPSRKASVASTRPGASDIS